MRVTLTAAAAAALGAALAGCALPGTGTGTAAGTTTAGETTATAAATTSSEAPPPATTPTPTDTVTTVSTTTSASAHTVPAPLGQTGGPTGPGDEGATPTVSATTPARLAADDPWTPGACTRPAGLPTALNPELARRWRLAQAGATKAGYTLTMTSGFRDWSTQATVYAQKVKALGTPAEARKWALPPQESTHVQGLAIDAGNEAAARWLLRVGWRYGLCQAYANEWWHFEMGPGVGVACPAPIPSAASLPKAPCP